MREGEREIEAVARAMWDARESRDPSGERIGDRDDDYTREAVFWDRAVAEDLWPASRRDQLNEAHAFLELLDRPLDRVRDAVSPSRARLVEALRPFVEAYDAVGRTFCPEFNGPDALAHFDRAAEILAEFSRPSTDDPTEKA